MFKHHATQVDFRKLWLLLVLVAGLLFLSVTGIAEAANPSCNAAMPAETGQKYTWDRDYVICYGIDIREFADVFVVEVKALDGSSRYDVYLDPVPTTSGQQLQTKINRKPIKSSQGTVKLVFNPQTLDFRQHYTVALVPRSDNQSGSRASIKFESNQVLGASRPVESDDGDILTLRSVAALDTTVERKGIASYHFKVSCPGNIEVDYRTSITDSNDPDPKVSVKLFGPDNDWRWTGTEADENETKQYWVNESHIHDGYDWFLQMNNQGNKSIAIVGEVRTPGKNCAPVPIKKTVTFRYSGNSMLVNDVTLEQESSNQNFGKQSICYVDGDDNGGYERNTLLFWDISSIPQGSRITKATIQLTVIDVSADAYYVYSARKPWRANTATWNQAGSSNFWSNGGATGPADRGSVVGKLSARNEGKAQINLQSSLVQDWVDGKRANYGVLIASSTAFDGIDFYCSEASKKSVRPQLVVEYER